MEYAQQRRCRRTALRAAADRQAVGRLKVRGTETKDREVLYD